MSKQVGQNELNFHCILYIVIRLKHLKADKSKVFYCSSEPGSYLTQRNFLIENILLHYATLNSQSLVDFQEYFFTDFLHTNGFT